MIWRTFSFPVTFQNMTWKCKIQAPKFSFQRTHRVVSHPLQMRGFGTFTTQERSTSLGNLWKKMHLADPYNRDHRDYTSQITIIDIIGIIQPSYIRILVFSFQVHHPLADNTYYVHTCLYIRDLSYPGGGSTRMRRLQMFFDLELKSSESFTKWGESHKNPLTFHYIILFNRNPYSGKLM